MPKRKVWENRSINMIGQNVMIIMLILIIIIVILIIAITSTILSDVAVNANWMIPHQDIQFAVGFAISKSQKPPKN